MHGRHCDFGFQSFTESKVVELEVFGQKLKVFVNQRSKVKFWTSSHGSILKIILVIFLPLQHILRRNS